MDLRGLPDQEAGGLSLSGLPDNNESVLRQQYRNTRSAPDDAAKVLDISKRTGLPKPVVERNRQEAERQAFEPDWADLETKAPKTVREMAANTKLFELANDDTENMAQIERTLNRRSAGMIGGPAFDRSRGDVKPSRGPSTSFSSVMSGQASVLPNTFERIRQGLRLEIADLFGLDTVQQDALRQRARVDFNEALQTPDIENTLGRWIYGGAANVQRIAPSIAATIATRSPSVGLAAMGAQVQPEAYGKYRARGGTPGEAAVGSAAETGIEIATERLPMGFLVDRFGKAGATQFIAGYLGRELPTEIAAEVAQGAIDTAIANPDKTWGQYAAELPDTIGQTVVSTLMMSGGLTAANAAVQRFAGPQAQAEAAQQDAQALQQLSQLAAANKLRGRSPEAFQQWIEAVNEDGAVQDVYLDTRTLQQAGIDPAALAAVSPAVAAQLEEAAATGGDIIIPVSEYATKIAGTDLDAVLTPHLRTGEDALSLDEAQRFYQGQQEEFQKAAAQIMEERAQDDAWQASASAVEAQLFEQLRSAGRFTDDVNTGYATLMRDFYVTTAARLGITPEEMFARYPLQVAAERMAGEARMEQGGSDMLKPLASLIQGKTFEAAKRAIVAQVGSVGAREKFDDDVADAVFLRLQRVAQVGRYTNMTDLAYRNARRLEGDGNITIYRAAPKGTSIRPGDFAAGSAREAGFYKHGANVVQKATVPRRDVIAVDGSSGGDQEYVYLPEGYTPPEPQEWFKSFREFFDATGNRGTFDPNDPNSLNQPTKNQGGNRGEISFSKDITQSPSVITLFKNADLSTLFHEMGHFQLEVLANIASQPNAPAEIVADMEKALAWFGIKGDENVAGGERAGSLGQGGVPQTDTPEFKAWFGDSKVVDAEGKPLVVYHGTGNEFSVFDYSRIGEQGRGEGAGFYFTNSKDVAAGYGKPMEVYLAIKNPLAYDAKPFKKSVIEKIVKRIAELEAEAEGGGIDNGFLSNFGDVAFDGLASVVRKAADLIAADDTALDQLSGIVGSGVNPEYVNRAAYEVTGHDGVIANGFSNSGDAANKIFVAFFPEQIKSATGNRGTFDPNDPNILHQGGEEGTKGELPKRRTPLEVWQAMSLEEKRPYHEQFARGFEAYLFEGKAPNPELNSLFRRFADWLKRVYKSMASLNVEINDELRGVFDRLIASEEAIKQAEAQRGYMAQFTEDAEANALARDATATAVEQLQTRSLRDMRWLTNARSRLLKELQADAKDKRKAVEAEVSAEVRAMPVYAARAFLQDNKLSIPALEEMYAGEGNRYALLDWSPLTQQRLAGKQGITPDQAAEVLGFTSGDHLVRELLAAENEAQLVEGMTDQRVLERYGDLASPDTINRAVDEAIHNEVRLRALATELKAATQAVGPARAIAQAAKAFAEATIARKKLRDIKPKQHAAAETRASKAATEALRKGDTAAYATEKRSQIVQAYSTRVAYDALTEIDKAAKYLRKFDSDGVRKNLDPEYTDQIDQLLERFDLRASTPANAAKKRASLLAWVESQREQGFEPDVPQDLLTEASRKPYRDLTLEELRGLVDTVKQIEHLGRLKKKLLTAKDEREFNAIRDEIAASIEANAKGVRDNRSRNTTGAMLKDAGNSFLAMHRKMASVAREMDGFEDGGPMWEYFIRSMNEAGNNETAKRAEATAKFYEMVKPLLKQGKMGGKGQYFETLGGSFNREERIAIALNLGNEGNIQRLLDGEGWTPVQLKPLLDTITPGEADFVQAVWDFFESYRPEIAAKERRIYGKEPEWVEPQPVTLGGKTLKGGYYPIKYDTRRSGRAEAFADAEAAKQQMRGAFTSATTRRSFTKSRAEEVTGRPLLYSLAGLYQGTNEVIHDLTWHEWLIDANRLLRSLDGAIRTHYGAETVGIFKKAIEDIAAGDVPAQNVFERGLNHVRTGATIAGLGWNLMTSLLQPIGLTQSMVRVGPGWVAKGMGQWIKAPLATIEEIQGKSEMMRDRARTMQREINEIQNQVQGSKLDPVRSTFFVLIQKMQMVADIPTWLGAYEKHIAAGETEDRAVALADQAVLDAQGGGQMKDLSQIQRGHPALKLFTNFYSFFNVAYNMGVEKTKQKIGQPKLYPSLAMDYLLLYVLPAALVTVMKDAILGGDDDEDKLVDKIIADQISYLLGTMVGLREVTAAVQKMAGVEQFKGSYGGPAGLRLFQEIDKLGQQVGQGEADMALFKAANNAAGIVFHYPSGQVNRTAEGIAAMAEGKTANPAALIVGPPK